MLPGDRASVVGSSIFGAIAGYFIAGFSGAVAGAALGAVFAYVAARSNVRPLIAITTFVGAAAGALIGSSIVETICLPDACPGYEISGAIVLGLASILGVGMVAALVARSFDEYNETVIKGEEPPGVGCEVPEGDV